MFSVEHRRYFLYPHPKGVPYPSMPWNLHGRSIVAHKTGTSQTINLMLSTIHLVIKSAKQKVAGSCTSAATKSSIHFLLYFHSKNSHQEISECILIFLWNAIGPLCVHPTRLYCKHLPSRVVEKVIEFRTAYRIKGAPEYCDATVCISKCNPQHILLPCLCWHEFSSFLKKGRLPPWCQKAIFINFAAVQAYP